MGRILDLLVLIVFFLGMSVRQAQGCQRGLSLPAPPPWIPASAGMTSCEEGEGVVCRASLVRCLAASIWWWILAWGVLSMHCCIEEVGDVFAVVGDV